MASLDMGPLNRYRRLAREHTRATIDTLCETIADRGTKPELEVFNDGHLNEVAGLLDRYDLDVPIYVNLLLGGGTLIPATPRNLLLLVDNLPDGTQLNTLAFGRHQLPLTTLGLIIGGHVRVGLEETSAIQRAN